MDVNSISASIPCCARQHGSDEYTKPEFQIEERANGTLLVRVSAEEGDGVAGYYPVSKYSDFGFVCEELEQWAAAKDAYWEWENSGEISCVIRARA